ncbi:hypothetical protein [Ruegeria sp.]|uniref:hypothetical protein n=1 Tax=Ruegeria sp. TaxID=1879320 RepID=UPI00231DE4C8|nr:hypothetical protein [Ruegeria sp.]MDA7966173.1 hypothetical protein [Ruegeria sp.]
MFRKVKKKLSGLWRPSRKLSKTVPPMDRKGYDTVFENNGFAILRQPGERQECTVSFTGIGHALGGIDVQNPEFSRSLSHETKIFVIDKERTWGNSVHWEETIAVLKRHTDGTEVTTLGNSMGGFLAILAAGQLRASRSIAFVPQWSIDPDIVPGETRWSNYRSNISKIIHPDLSAAFVDSTKFYVFFGNGPSDQEHLKYFREKQDRMKLFVLDRCDHNVAHFLKERGQLYPVIHACHSDSDIHHVLAKADIRLD